MKKSIFAALAMLSLALAVTIAPLGEALANPNDGTERGRYFDIRGSN